MDSCNVPGDSGLGRVHQIWKNVLIGLSAKLHTTRQAAPTGPLLFLGRSFLHPFLGGKVWPANSWEADDYLGQVTNVLV